MFCNPRVYGTEPGFWHVHLVLSGLLTATWCRHWELLHCLRGRWPRWAWLLAQPGHSLPQGTARPWPVVLSTFNPITATPRVLATLEFWDKTGFDVHFSLPREGLSTVSFPYWEQTFSEVGQFFLPDIQIRGLISTPFYWQRLLTFPLLRKSLFLSVLHQRSHYFLLLLPRKTLALHVLLQIKPCSWTPGKWVPCSS